MNQRVHLDANVILRFFRNDDSKQSPAAAGLIKKSMEQKVSLVVSSVTVSEVFYALTTSYKLSRPEAARIILPFVQTGVAEFECEACLMDALQKVIEKNVDFGDAYLAAHAADQGEWVASFDHDLKKFKDVKHYDFDEKR